MRFQKHVRCRSVEDTCSDPLNRPASFAYAVGFALFSFFLALLYCASPAGEALADDQGNSVVSVRGESGANVQIEIRAIVRVRETTTSERRLHPEGLTLIDYAVPLYVRDKVDTLIAVLTSPGRLKTLGHLIMPNGSSVWFDGKRSQGPLPVPSGFRESGTNSALNIGGRVQYVRSMPEEVYQVVSANGGLALPYGEAVVASRGARDDEDRAGLQPAAQWDADVPELAVKGGNSE